MDSDLGTPFRNSPKGLLINLRLQPGAGRDRVEGLARLACATDWRTGPQACCNFDCPAPGGASPAVAVLMGAGAVALDGGHRRV